MDKFIHITKQTDSIIEVPPSKSVAQRALFAAALCKKTVSLKNTGYCEDVQHIKSIIKQLGYEIQEKDSVTTLIKTDNPVNQIMQVGESGLGSRLSTPILSHYSEHFTINGKGTLLKRPMTWFKKHLPQMGTDISLNGDFLPLKGFGKIKSGNYCVDGSESSQYISGLLMVLPLCEGNSILEVTEPVSTPYIDITLDILAEFGIEVSHQDYQQFNIPGQQQYSFSDMPYIVEGDYSSAAFWIVFGLMTNGIQLSGLRQDASQADIAILDVVTMVGGSYSWQDSILNIVAPDQLSPFSFDATHCPDLFPILTTLAAAIKGKSSIKGSERLVHKESNRKQVLLEEFSKLDLKIDNRNNSFEIDGTGRLLSGKIFSHNDHRIAMAFSIASYLTPSGLTISDPDCVKKSYPNFWETINTL